MFYTCQIIVIIVERRLCLGNEISTGDGTVLILLYIEVGQNGQRTNSGIRKVSSVCLIAVSRIAYIIDYNRIASRSGSSEDGANVL